MACETRQENDEMVCRCGLRWSVNDPDPPVCQKTTVRAARDNFLHETGSTRRNYAFTSGDANPFPVDKADRRFWVALDEPPAPPKFRVAPVPVTLPENVAADMAIAFNEFMRHEPDNYVGAMQAAHRVFLDSLP